MITLQPQKYKKLWHQLNPVQTPRQSKQTTASNSNSAAEPAGTEFNKATNGTVALPNVTQTFEDLELPGRMEDGSRIQYCRTILTTLALYSLCISCSDQRDQNMPYSFKKWDSIFTLQITVCMIQCLQIYPKQNFVSTSDLMFHPAFK